MLVSICQAVLPRCDPEPAQRQSQWGISENHPPHPWLVAHWNIVGELAGSVHDLVKLQVEVAEVGAQRKVHDQVDEEDPTSADLLHEFIARLEQFAWMVQAEIMPPR